YPIAKKIVAAREVAPIETTFQLVDIIKSALPARILSKKGHPAKQSFQALRMEVNQELQSVKTAIADGCELLKPSGIGCVITFHSLEDRIVKDIFKQLSSAPKTNKRLPMEEVAVDFTLITRKPITASQEELEENPRAHSAKLRVIQRKGD
ncbi:MAG TPA: 16S rRNA (cytosine(1402)-N(4))-methyltransferase, partial [Erysipelotrichaceae bacterium]|nr:16S rRNA (cytosine(1402)-N(4))-methyltransferase [Erysipelotrichaceae bacterium]